MLRNVVEPIVRTASNFQHISILQGTKVYGVHLHPIPIPARERDARKDHPNFFFDQEAYVGEIGAKHGFNFTALRPQLVTGPTPGALNVLAAIGVYAAIRREKGETAEYDRSPWFTPPCRVTCPNSRINDAGPRKEDVRPKASARGTIVTPSPCSGGDRKTSNCATSTKSPEILATARNVSAIGPAIMRCVKLPSGAPMATHSGLTKSAWIEKSGLSRWAKYRLCCTA
jgi:hypothetical protein